MFDLDVAFEEFTSQFGGKTDEGRTRALWDTLVNGDEAEACHADLMSRVTPGMRAASAEWALKKFGARLPTSETREVVTASLGLAPKPLEADQVAFSSIWATWPHNPVRENRSSAYGAFTVAVRKYGLQQVVAACDYFVRFVSPSFEFCPHVATFVSEQIAEYAEAASSAPTDEDIDDFNSAYNAYPDFDGKKASADTMRARLFHFVRVVKAEDRLLFQAAVRAYAKKYAARCEEYDEDDDEGHYVKSWKSFLGGGWRDIDVSRTLLAAIQAAAGVRRHVPFEPGTSAADMVVGLVDAHNRALAEERATYDAAEPRPDGWLRSPRERWPLDPDDVGARYADDDRGRREPSETDRFVRSEHERSMYGCYCKPCRCYCRKRPAVHRGCAAHWLRADRRPDCAECVKNSTAADCALDPCTCGERDERYTGPCGREGCAGEACMCGGWLEQPAPDLVVDVAQTLKAAHKILVAPGPLPEASLYAPIVAPSPWIPLRDVS